MTPGYLADLQFFLTCSKLFFFLNALTIKTNHICINYHSLCICFCHWWNKTTRDFQYRRHTIGRGDSCNGLSLRASSPFGESREVTREKQAKGDALPLTCVLSWLTSLAIHGELAKLQLDYTGMQTKAWKTTAKTVNDQCSSTLDQTRSWSVEKDKNKIKVKKTTAKTDQTKWKMLRYTIFRLANTSLHQVVLGLTTNIRNIYYSEIINGSYMLWPGKVWLWSFVISLL